MKRTDWHRAFWSTCKELNVRPKINVWPQTGMWQLNVSKDGTDGGGWTIATEPTISECYKKVTNSIRLVEGLPPIASDELL